MSKKNEDAQIENFLMKVFTGGAKNFVSSQLPNAEPEAVDARIHKAAQTQTAEFLRDYR